MDDGDVTVVLQALDAVGARDAVRAAALFTPDVEWHNTASFPGERVWHGPDGVIAFMRTLSEGFVGNTLEYERSEQHGRFVAAEFRSRGRGKASGLPLDVRWGAVFELREGRVARVDIHGAYKGALAAVRARAP